MDTNFTKQYLINYDSAILLPYTTIDCILADEDGAVSGTQAIISSILSNDDILIYEKNPEHTGEKYIHQSNLNGENLYMIGMYNDGTNNAFIKMHAISDREDAANQYLGADGDVHAIGNGTKEEIIIYQSNLTGLNGNAVDYTWFTGDVLFDSSSCQVNLRPSLNIEDFYVQNGELRVRTADHVKKAQYLVNSSNETINISKNGSNPVLIEFNNGVPNINNIDVGYGNKFIYLDNGSFKQGDASYGVETNDGVQLWKVESGEFKNLPDTFDYANSEGNNNEAYTLGVSRGILCKNSVDIGDEAQLIYLKQGKFIESNFTLSAIDTSYGGTIIEEERVNTYTLAQSSYPLSIVNGQFANCSPTGSDYKPIYIDEDGKLAECTNIALENINKPIYDTEENPSYYMFISEKDDGNHKYNNNWKSINHFVRTVLPEATIPGDINDGTASILVARPVEYIKQKTSYTYDGSTYTPNNVIVSTDETDDDRQNNPDYRPELDPTSGPDVYNSVLLSTLIHEFEEYSEFSGEKQLRWEQMRASVEVTTEGSDQDLAFYLTGVYAGVYNDTTLSTFENYHDLNNNIAKKLEVATNQIKCSEDNTIKGIYFKQCKLYQTSDERLKTFVSDLDINLDHLATIKKGIFFWKDDKKQRLDIGVTAQSVEQYFPQIVDEDNGVKTVSYEKLSVVALAAIDKLNEKIKNLEKEIQELKHNV